MTTMCSVVSLDLIQDNLFSPMVLAFVLGLLAVRLKSDLKLPDGMYTVLSYYLLLSLGLKGGAYLRDSTFCQIIWPCIAAGIIGCVLPLMAYSIARFVKFNKFDSAALAAHYGSVSVVTFMAALVFVEKAGNIADGFMTALVAILEIPGIIIALLFVQERGAITRKHEDSTSPTQQLPTTLYSTSLVVLWKKIKAILVGKSIFLLLGGLFIGFISGPKGIEPIAPFFIAPFKGVLVLFLLDMGLLAGQRLEDVSSLPPVVGVYAIVIPLLNAVLAILVAHAINLSIGSATVFAAMAASASYIAAPAAVRMSIPKANPAIYLTSAIVITFPFNLAIGIPLYHVMTQFWYGVCR